MNKKGHIVKVSNQLGASDVIELALEANLKTKQLRVINEFIRQRLGSKIMHKEEDILSKMKEIKGGIEFADFDEKACGNTFYFINLISLHTQ